MPQKTIDTLIINSPWEEPKEHWRYDRKTRLFDRVNGRRSAGYLAASPDAKSFDDPGVFHEIKQVNQVRGRVKAWRAAGYPGVSGVTRRLLEYWRDPEEFETRQFFFCQLEAVETLIWLSEAPAAERTGIDIPSDGGPFQRLCAKMATGSGKTVVMAMVIAWHILNKAAYPQDPRFSRNVLVVAPGLTVRNRLAVLQPAHKDNYYEAFRIVPDGFGDRLRQGRVEVRNWHALNWETEEQLARKRSVDKRGPRSDAAYVRGALGDMAAARNLLVINDEAHHAWRVPAGGSIKGVSRSELVAATKWIGGLDRIHRARGILACYDFSATPFTPSGKRHAEETLFDWVVSDFGLNDAIESGLVKTPRVVVRDDAVPDAKTYKSRLYHIYNDPEVKDDLNRDAPATEPLPDLVVNGYYLLGYDWRETAREWEQRQAGQHEEPTPPVMITVANRTHTAARIKHMFDQGKVRIDQLCDPERTLHIDSRTLEQAEEAEEPIARLENAADQAAANGKRKLTQKQQAELLRRQVDTVGQAGREGAHIQNVISVGMLSEGWDAKTVTHIMGLRAFTSQLLCEQVVGRGLRRTSYDVNEENGLLDAEYVNVFGIPFTFLPHEGIVINGNGPPPPPPPKTLVQPDPDKAEYELSWPNVVRINHSYRTQLSLNWSEVKTLELDAAKTAKLAELAPIVEGKPDVTQMTLIELEKLAREFRFQRIAFETARDLQQQMPGEWQGGREYLMAQLVRLVEQFIQSDRIRITPALFNDDDLRRRLILTLNMARLVQHIWKAIRAENTERLEPEFNQERPIRFTGDMRPWYTSRPCQYTRHSHINYCVLDSAWEASDAFALDHSPCVRAWVKNDHLGFDVTYIHKGTVRKYRPDFLVRLATGDMLVLETKGREDEQTQAKHEALDEWVRAVSEHGGFGRWHWDAARTPGAIRDILHRLAPESAPRAGADADAAAAGAAAAPA